MTIFVVYSIVPITVALTAPFLWADSAADYKRPAEEDSDEHTEAPASKNGAHQDTWYELYVALKAHAFTSDYAWLLAITASGLVRINFYLGTVELQLRQLVDPSSASRSPNDSTH